MNSFKLIPFSYQNLARLLSSVLSIILLANVPAQSYTSSAAAIKVLQKQTNYYFTMPVTSIREMDVRDNDMNKGFWSSRQTPVRYCIQFEGGDEESNWNMSKCFTKADFQKKDNGVFQLTRETGTLSLKGNLEAEEGEGTYEFTADATFSKYLADNKLSSHDDNFIFHLYMANMSREYIEYLKKNYTEVSGERLLELAIHGVTQKKFQEYVSLFEKHNKQKPSIGEVIEAKIHGVDAGYIEQLQAAGFTNLPMKKMIEAKIHGVNGEYVKHMQATGFTNLSIDKMIETKIHGVNAGYIDVLKKAGYTDLGIDKVIEAKIHGISPGFVEGMSAMGYKELSIDKLIEAKIHGVNGEYVQGLEKEGFSQLPINKLIEAKIHGVTGEFIARAKTKGYKFDRIGDYVNLKIHGMAKNDE